VVGLLNNLAAKADGRDWVCRIRARRRTKRKTAPSTQDQIQDQHQLLAPLPESSVGVLPEVAVPAVDQRQETDRKRQYDLLYQYVSQPLPVIDPRLFKRQRPSVPTTSLAAASSTSPTDAPATLSLQPQPQPQQPRAQPVDDHEVRRSTGGRRSAPTTLALLAPAQVPYYSLWTG
jgi:hypothetical protein